MSLSEIFCQDRVVSILRQGYGAGKSAHAFIFAGIDGVGKFTVAKQYAKLLLCEKPTKDDSCGQCKSCQSIESDSHPDFIHIYKELVEFTKNGKGKTTPVDLPIDVIREFLIETAPKRPTLSERKVFVVSEAEKLNANSQNALLKVLEEPPCYCTIILICTRLEKLLPTTKSRCQIVRFNQIDEEKIITHLKDLGLDTKRSTFFARFSDGSIGQAETYAKLELESQKLYEMKVGILNTLADLKYDQCLDVAQEFGGLASGLAKIWAGWDKTISTKDLKRRSIGYVINVVISALRDAMKVGIGQQDSMINADQKQIIQKVSGKYDSEIMAEKIEECFENIKWLEASVNEKLLFERLLLNLAESATMQV